MRAKQLVFILNGGSDDLFPFQTGFRCCAAGNRNFLAPCFFHATLINRHVKILTGTIPQSERRLRFDPLECGSCRRGTGPNRSWPAPPSPNFARPTGRLFTLSSGVGVTGCTMRRTCPGFFAYLIEHEIYAQADREKGKIPIVSARLAEEFPGARLRPRKNAQTRRFVRFSPFR